MTSFDFKVCVFYSGQVDKRLHCVKAVLPALSFLMNAIQTI
jgi:hypothetical protein